MQIIAHFANKLIQLNWSASKIPIPLVFNTDINYCYYDKEE